MTDYDVPWEEVLDACLNDFLELCLPHIHAGIDWVMDLPSPLELQFSDTLMQIESEKHMPYVTSIERLAKNEGKIEVGILLRNQEVPRGDSVPINAAQCNLLFGAILTEKTRRGERYHSKLRCPSGSRATSG